MSGDIYSITGISGLNPYVYENFTPTPYNCVVPVSNVRLINACYSSTNEWVDFFLSRKTLYGHRIINEDTGARDLALIPGNYINYAPVETEIGATGKLIQADLNINGGFYNLYEKYQNFQTTRYLKNKQTGQEIIQDIWNTGVPNAAIISVDASKITNRASLFTGTTDDADPYVDQYGNIRTGFLRVPIISNVQVSNNNPTPNTKLVSILNLKTLKTNLLPLLKTSKGQVFDYDPNLDNGATTDGVTVRLQNLISNDANNSLALGSDSLLYNKVIIKPSNTLTITNDTAGTGYEIKKTNAITPEYLDFSNRVFVKQFISTDFTSWQHTTSNDYAINEGNGNLNLADGRVIYKDFDLQLPDMGVTGYKWLIDVDTIFSTGVNLANHKTQLQGKIVYRDSNTVDLMNNSKETYTSVIHIDYNQKTYSTTGSDALAGVSQGWRCTGSSKLSSTNNNKITYRMYLEVTPPNGVTFNNLIPAGSSTAISVENWFNSFNVVFTLLGKIPA